MILPHVTEATKDEAARRVAAGETARQVADALNIGCTTVREACRARGVRGPNQRRPPAVSSSGWRVIRPDVARARTENVQRLPKTTLALGAAEYPRSEHPRAGHGKPATVGECRDLGLGTALRCPYVSCRYHLALGVDEGNGSLRYSQPDGDPSLMLDTCALAVADRGGLTLDEVGERINLTRERVRQVETDALARLRALLPPDARAMLDAFLDAERLAEPRTPALPAPVVRRYLPVVRAEAPPERPALDAEARALAATRAPFLSPRTWERSAARRLP